MTTYDYAKSEFERADWFDGDMNQRMAENVLELIKAFGGQGHSGFSANYCIRLFSRLASFLPLSPLTGEDDEWNKIDDNTFQNRRCSTIFKENGKAYNIEGKVFREPSGACYANNDSRIEITFPYAVPDNPEYVDVEAEA